MSGFTKPTTTQTPDALFDYWLTRLTGSELRVLLYAIRRTFGFGKDSDAISLNQFLRGITTQDGRVLDEMLSEEKQPSRAAEVAADSRLAYNKLRKLLEV